MVAEDFDPREHERRQLEALPSKEREVIEASVGRSRKESDRIQATLKSVVASLNTSWGDDTARLVGLENRFKTESSLARAYAAEFEAEGTSPADFLKNTKDRVRFSIQLDERDYHRRVVAAIADLRDRGYQVSRAVNFWGGGGRHNGLNVTVIDPQNVTFELQFPTELSSSISEDTHTLYEVLRHDFAPYPARVDAFLRILAINIREGIAGRQPDGAGELKNQLGISDWKDVDSTFRAWVRAKNTSWNSYLDDIHAEGSSFDRILARTGLTQADVLESTGSDGDDRHNIRLSGDPEVRHVGRGYQPDRLRGAEPPLTSRGDVERAAESMDLRSSGGSDLPVRSELPGEGPTTRPPRSGTAGSGDPTVRTTHGADSPEDVGRGPEDGLGLRSAAGITDVNPNEGSSADPAPQPPDAIRPDVDSAETPPIRPDEELDLASEGTAREGLARSDNPDWPSGLSSETTASGEAWGAEGGVPLRGETVATNAGEVVINTQVGQTLGALGDAFEVGPHYLDLFEYEHERRQAERLGDLYDVRALEADHGRTDELGNPDVIVRTGEADPGAYGDLKRLDPDLQPNLKDADYSRRVEKRLREPFGQDPRITVAVVDGRDVGLTIDAAVRGIRRALGFWRQQGREVLPEQRMIVFTGDGGSVVWRGDTGDINVSA